MKKIILIYHESTNEQIEPPEFTVEYENIPIDIKDTALNSLIKQAIKKLLTELS